MLFFKKLKKLFWLLFSKVAATNFPTSLDSYSTKNSGDTISESHINDPQDAIEALEAKVGVDSSAVTTSHDYKLSHLFNDRGDSSGTDYTHANLTEDGTWRDLDLSSIVSAGAKAVLMTVYCSAPAAGWSLQFRENGNSNAANVAFISTQVADIVIYDCLIVACDTNRVIEYNATNGAWNSIGIYIRGWWT